VSTDYALQLPKDIKVLTSLRFFAALMIVVVHAHAAFPVAWPARAPNALVQGVSFFFVLSGFILTHVYHDRPDLSYWRFLLQRIARLCPLLLASMLFVLLALPAREIAVNGGGIGRFVLKILMLDSLIPTGAVQFSWNGVTWSISTEMFFYAAFPFLLKDIFTDAPKTLAASALIAIAVYLIGQLLDLPVQGRSNDDVTLYQLGYANPLVRGFEFVLGMTAYVSWKRWIQPLRLGPLAWAAIEACLIIALLLWMGLAVDAVTPRLTTPLRLWFDTSGSCWLFALLIVAAASSRGPAVMLLAWRPFVWLGEISFAVYLFHQPVMNGLAYHFGPDMPIPIIFAVIVAVAAAAHHGMETPARRYILNIAGRVRPTSTANDLSEARVQAEIAPALSK
jgi:peptidoglycan/LPS O-acetylase OafA/YrhL